MKILSKQSGEKQNTTDKQKVFSLLRTMVVIIVLSLLLWWALKNVNFQEIWETLLILQWWQILLLLGLNTIVIALIAARWWLIAKAGNQKIPLFPLIGYRLAVFGLSYFTPGPQVGGEPLQVIYLQRNHGFTYPRATAAVIMDKLIEFLANFLVLGVGFWAVIESGLIASLNTSPGLGLVGLGLLLTWPLVHISLLYRNILPITRILKIIPGVNKKTQLFRLIAVSERMAAGFCQRHTRALIGAIGLSLVALVGIGAEYFLMAHYLGLELSLIQLLAALTFLQLAFLVPLPGGLGALEASQVFALGVFGQPAAAAISLTLLQRGRDLLNGGIGLLIAGKDATNRQL